MLRIKQRLTTLGHDIGNRGTDVLDILLKADAQRRLYMKVMRLAHKTNILCARVHDLSKHIVVLGRAPCPLGHAKGRKARPRLGRFVEEVTVRRVRPGPAAFDIIHPQLIQHRRDAVLLRRGKLNALGLLPVAQGCVVDIETFSHWPSLARACAMPDLVRAFATGCKGASAAPQPSARNSGLENALPGGRSGMAHARRWLSAISIKLVPPSCLHRNSDLETSLPPLSTF